MFFFYDAIEVRKENEENTIEEFSESDLNDIPDSPLISAGLPRKVSIESAVLRVIPEDDGQKAREEEKDRIVNYEGEHKKKDNTQLSITIPNTTVKRGSKLKQITQITSLKKSETNDLLKMSNHQPINMKNWDNDFERVHVFRRYFVKNNVDVVLKQFENFMIKKVARIQKLKQMKRKKTIIGSPLKSSRYQISNFSKKLGGIIKPLNEVSEDNRSVMQSPHHEISSSWNLEEK